MIMLQMRTCSRYLPNQAEPKANKSVHSLTNFTSVSKTSTGIYSLYSLIVSPTTPPENKKRYFHFAVIPFSQQHPGH